MTDYPLVNAMMFAGLGVVVYAVALAVLSRLAPLRLWDEIRDRNTAAAIAAGAVALGVAVIVAATMH
jgi:uncharacterized membrane protein YjfL (UPF0719 family)